MKTMHLKAKPGLRVPYPENSRKYLEGPDAADVDVSTYPQLEYWTRRIDHGEVDTVDDSAVSTAAVAPSAIAETPEPSPTNITVDHADKE